MDASIKGKNFGPLADHVEEHYGATKTAEILRGMKHGESYRPSHHFDEGWRETGEAAVTPMDTLRRIQKAPQIIPGVHLVHGRELTQDARMQDKHGPRNVRGFHLYDMRGKGPPSQYYESDDGHHEYENAEYHTQLEEYLDDHLPKFFSATVPEGSLYHKDIPSSDRMIDLARDPEFLAKLKKLDGEQQKRFFARLEELEKEKYGERIGTKNPVMLYHGSPHDLKELKATEGQRANTALFGFNYPVQNQGAFLSDSPRVARYFGQNRAEHAGQAQVHKVYANLDKIIDLTGKPGIWRRLDDPKYVEKIKAKGYHGAKFREDAHVRKATDPKAHSYIIFDPEKHTVVHRAENRNIQTPADVDAHQDRFLPFARDLPKNLRTDSSKRAMITGLTPGGDCEHCGKKDVALIHVKAEGDKGKEIKLGSTCAGRLCHTTTGEKLHRAKLVRHGHSMNLLKKDGHEPEYPRIMYDSERLDLARKPARLTKENYSHGDTTYTGWKTVGDNKYSFHLRPSPITPDKHVFMFVQHGQDDKGTELTGAGNAMQVMGHAAAHLINGVRKLKPAKVTFDAKEPSRQKLYRRLVEKLPKYLPNYKTTEVSPGKWEMRDTKVALARHITEIAHAFHPDKSPTAYADALAEAGHPLARFVRQAKLGPPLIQTSLGHEWTRKPGERGRAEIHVPRAKHLEAPELGIHRVGFHYSPDAGAGNIVVTMKTSDPASSREIIWHAPATKGDLKDLGLRNRRMKLARELPHNLTELWKHAVHGGDNEALGILGDQVEEAGHDLLGELLRRGARYRAKYGTNWTGDHWPQDSFATDSAGEYLYTTQKGRQSWRPPNGQPAFPWLHIRNPETGDASLRIPLRPEEWQAYRERYVAPDSRIDRQKIKPHEEPDLTLARPEVIADAISTQQTTRRKLAAKIAIQAGLRLQALQNARTNTQAGVTQVYGHDNEPDAVDYAAAWYGLLSRSPRLTSFHVHDGGPDTYHTWKTSANPDTVLATAQRLGLNAVVTSEGHVSVLDQGNQSAAPVSALKEATYANTPVSEPGTAKPFASRDDYRASIRAYEQSVVGNRPSAPAAAGGPGAA